MNVAKMRVELEKKYNKAFVAKKSDVQVTAIFLRLKAQNKI